VIIFFDRDRTARNSLYPFILPGKNNIVLGYDFKIYSHDMPFYLIISSLIVLILSAVNSFSDSGRKEIFYCIAVAGQVALVATKLWRQRGVKLTFNINSPSFGSRPAPLLAWVENLAMSANFVMIGKIGYLFAASDLTKFLSLFLVFFYVTLSILPLFNYIKWKINTVK